MAPRRPTGVAILAILDFLAGALILLGGLVLIAVGGTGLLASLGYGFFAGIATLLGAVVLVIGVLAIVVGWGLWTGKRWAWILALILYALGALSSLVSLAGGSVSSVVGLVIDALLIWYLFRPHVKAFFGQGAPQPVASPSAPSPLTTT